MNPFESIKRIAVLRLTQVKPVLMFKLTPEALKHLLSKVPPEK